MRQPTLRILLAGAVSAAAVVASSGAAQAGGFALREQSAAGLGMAFAGVGAGSAGLGSMFWNPAILTKIPGIQFESVISGIFPYAKFNAGPGSAARFDGLSTGDLAQDAALPASYSSIQLNDKLWVGLGLNTPYGLTTKPSSDFGVGRGYGFSTSVLSFELTPTVAYKINDMISVAAGLRVMHFQTTYKSFFNAPTVGLPASQNQAFGIEGDSMGYGFTLGATITPFAGTEIGIGYRSAVEQELKGTFNGLTFSFPFNVAPATAPLRAAFPTSLVKSKVVLPETITVGIKQTINEQFSVSAGFEWTNWSRVGYPRVVQESNGSLYPGSPFLPLGYKDGWYASIGGEYKIDPTWTVRAGLAYEKSPIGTETRSLRLPDNDRIWATLGASYNFNQKLTFDIGYAHIFPANTNVALVPGNPGYSTTYGSLVGKVDAHVDIVSVGVKFRWDDPSKTIPVVAKY
jgi:long-chain fatty acid transport protein